MPTKDKKQKAKIEAQRQKRVRAEKNAALGRTPEVIAAEKVEQMKRIQPLGAAAAKVWNEQNPRVGISNAAVAALATMRYRVPPAAGDAEAQVAGYALSRIIDVMAGRVHSKKAPSVLKAATEMRTEICGAIPLKQEISGGLTLEHLVASASREETLIEALPPSPEAIQ